MKKVLFYYTLIVITFFCFELKLSALSSITLSEGTLNPYFIKSIYKYNVFIKNNTKEINVNGILEEDDDYILGTGTIKLQNGENDITLDLYKKNSEHLTYVIKVFVGDEIINNDNLLKKLKIENYDIEYNPNIQNYNINIEKETELKIIYEANDDVSVKLIGNSNLKSGSIIQIIVKKENTELIYKIKVNKSEKVFKEEVKKGTFFSKIILNKQDKLVLRIFILSIILFLILLLYFLLFVKKGKRNKRAKQRL